MPSSDTLVSELQELDVTNVYIYVGDAVRWDSVDANVARLGATVKTAGASTTSAPSFSSLLTGLRVTTHNVYSFKHRLSPDTFRMLDVDGYNTEFLNSIFAYAQRDHDGVDPIYPVLGVNDTTNIRELDSIQPPFLFMERGPGGHIPYGECRSTQLYFQQELTPEKLRDDYRRSIELDTGIFEERMKTLRSRDLLDDTLVIYTSDHGELLGEGGSVGHNSPMCPELVHVPTVFIHEDISETVVESPLLSHIDLLPTVLSIVGAGVDEAMFDGTSMLSESPNSPACCFYNKEFLSAPRAFGRELNIALKYDGVWDADGGYVFPRSHIFNRLLVLAGKMAKSPKRSYLRKNFRSAVVSYSRGEQTFGTPTVPKHTAKEILTAFHQEGGSESIGDLSDSQQEQLRDLGYL